jgi:hypothetical protein
MTNDEVEEIQAELSDLQGDLEEAVQHLSSAVSCETEEDLRANLGDLRRSLISINLDIDELYRRSGGKIALRIRPKRKQDANDD